MTKLLQSSISRWLFSLFPVFNILLKKFRGKQKSRHLKWNKNLSNKLFSVLTFAAFDEKLQNIFSRQQKDVMKATISFHWVLEHGWQTMRRSFNEYIKFSKVLDFRETASILLNCAWKTVIAFILFASLKIAIWQNIKRWITYFGVRTNSFEDSSMLNGYT